MSQNCLEMFEEFQKLIEIVPVREKYKSKFKAKPMCNSPLWAHCLASGYAVL